MRSVCDAEPERPLVETLAEYLAGQEALLVLDNCEQVLAPAAGLAEELLRSVADLSVLATSREALGITGELAWRVPSLDLATGVRAVRREGGAGPSRLQA